MQYLSHEWIAAADAALGSAWETVTDRGSEDTIVLWEVNGAPQGKVSFALRFGPDGAGFTEGPPPDPPDATMSLDYATAVSIAQAALSPQVAFMQGALKLGGDVMVLVSRASALEAIGDAFATLRSQTEF